MSKVITLILLSVGIQTITANLCGPKVKNKPEDFAKSRLELLDEYHRHCQKVTGADPKLVQKARNGEFEEDTKLKNHFFCVAQKIGIQANTGDFQPTMYRKRVLEVVDDEKALNLIVLACQVKKKTPEDSAFNTFKCISQCTNYFGA